MTIKESAITSCEHCGRILDVNKELTDEFYRLGYIKAFKKVEELIEDKILEKTIATFETSVKKFGSGGHIVIPAKYRDHKAHVRIFKKKVTKEQK